MSDTFLWLGALFVVGVLAALVLVPLAIVAVGVVSEVRRLREKRAARRLTEADRRWLVEVGIRPW